MGIYTGSLHIDQALTNVSLMYKNATFVAGRVFPMVPVGKQSNKYWVYDISNLRSQEDARRPGGMSNEINWNLSTNPYYCDGHALHQYIADEERENADAGIDLDSDSTEQLTEKILLNQEINLVNALLASSMTIVDLSAGGGAHQLDNNANDPIAYFDAQKEVIAAQIGQTPNCHLFSRPGWRAFRNNTNVLKHIFGTSVIAPGQQIDVNQAKDLLEVEDVIIAEPINVTSAEGITPVTAQYVWGQFASTNGVLSMQFYRPPAPGLKTVSLGYGFTWNTGRLGSLVYKARADKRHADWIEVMRYYDNRVVAPGAGILYKNCTSA